MRCGCRCGVRFLQRQHPARAELDPSPGPSMAPSPHTRAQAAVAANGLFHAGVRVTGRARARHRRAPLTTAVTDSLLSRRELLSGIGLGAAALPAQGAAPQSAPPAVSAVVDGAQ